MTEEEKLLKRKIEAGNFAGSNGRIIRTINVLKGRWIKLGVVKEALPDVDDIDQCLIYLERSDYVKVRDIETKQTVEVETADDNMAEITLTKGGIDLALYYRVDPAVKV